MGLFRREGSNQNIIVGLILLVVLAFLAGPGTISRFLAPISPYFEGVPCERLRAADDRANHQSLLGRAAQDALELRVTISALPVDASGSMYISITVINNSVGAVPIVYDPNEVIVGDNGTSGLGIIFSSNAVVNGIGLGVRSEQPATVPEENIRVLGPRQRCIHTIDIAGGSILNNPSFVSGQTTVVAFYRGNARGTVPAANPTPIFNDQGLPIGNVVSDAAVIPLTGQ